MNPSASGAPGRNYLLVTGILLVIFSVYSLFGVIAALILSLASLSLGMVGIILLLATLVASASGIMGIINREKPEKAKACMGLGITMLVIAGLNLIASSSAGEFSFFSTLCGLVLPILYTIGASKNKAVAQQSGNF